MVWKLLQHKTTQKSLLSSSGQAESVIALKKEWIKARQTKGNVCGISS